ncbi:HxsD-like protein [Butyrivibrio proteoclasticus]|uniref:HxsD-like protein n=1 Tax=Butyrivibrio proteoclasticus TaxID=43305 RepID=UPI0005AB88D1|nr:HxsD-like protein [Butyrivibrio proteoclasticus]
MSEHVFKLDIYSRENIEKTISVYKPFTQVEKTEQDDSVILRFEKCKYSEEQTVKEFENYLIGLESTK